MQSKPTAIMNNTSLIIKQLRLKNQLTQEQLASYLQLKNREQISYYETEGREIPLDILEKLSDLFGIELEDFFEEDISEINSTIAFAYRATSLTNEDIDELSKFKKIVKNYNKMLRLEGHDAN